MAETEEADLLITEPANYIEKILETGRSLQDVVIHGMSPLNYFLALFDEDLSAEIIRNGKGLDLNDSIVGGFTPLHYTADNDMRSLIALLLERKADLEATTEDLRVVGHYESGGRTPLHLACIKGHDEVVKQLIAAGANRNARDFDGNTPFILACMNNHPNAASLVDGKETPPELEWLTEKAKADRAAAMARSQRDMCPSGTLMQVHVLPQLLSQWECKQVLEAVLAATEAQGWTANRHRAYATTDIQSCQLPAVDRWVRQTLRERLFPALNRLFFLRNAMEFSFRDLFFVKYCAEGQRGLSVHLDGSILSFNVLLNPASEFEGGGTFVEHLGKTFGITQGDCFVHSGRVRHAGTNVTRGNRYILVGFVDVRLTGSRSLVTCDLEELTKMD